MSRALDLRTLLEVRRELKSQVSGFRSDTIRGKATHDFVQRFVLHWLGAMIQDAEADRARHAARMREVWRRRRAGIKLTASERATIVAIAVKRQPVQSSESPAGGGA